MKKKILKLVTLALILVLVTSAFSGCGFAGVSDQSDKSFSQSTPVSGNKLCVEWSDAISGCNTSLTQNKNDGFWITPLNASNDYGIGSQNGFTMFRIIAIMMYESIFNTTYTQTDYFHGPKWTRLDIAPKTVIEKSMEETANALTLYSTGDDSTYAGVHKSLYGVLSTIKSIAMGILVAMWCIEFISQIVSERFTMETVLKTLMQLLCGILIIENANVLVAAFAQTGNALSWEIGEAGNFDQFEEYQRTINNTLLTGITSLNIAWDFDIFMLGLGTFWIDYGCLIVIVSMLFPMIMQIMCAYKIISRMIMRMLELTVRITLAPIPLAFSAQRGFGPDTIKYLRKCLACAMEPALMFIGVACIESIANVIANIVGMNTSGLFTGALTMSLSYLVLSAYLGTTKNLAQDVIAG